MRPALRLWAASVAALSTVLAGCGTVGDLLGAGTETGPRTAEVVVLVPATGKQADAGAAVVEAVRLAVGDSELAPPGWSVEVVEADDAGDPVRAAEVADEVAADERVVAVVGGLSAQVVRAVQPVLAPASVPFVSPADVAPEHTRGADPAAPMRPYASYFRTALAGGDPVAVAADYAVTGLGARRVAVVDGGSGPDADRFRSRAERLGAEVVAFGATGRDGAGVDAVIAAAVAHQAGALYVAGDAELAGRVARRLAGTGLAATLVGGASLRTEEFLAEAGTAADGAVAVVGPQVASGRQLGGDLTARLAEAGIEAAGSFAAAAYDAGAAVARALSGCLPGAETAAQARAACVGELDRVSFPGVTGEVAFDRYGDRTGGVPTVFEVRDGAWHEVGAA